MKKIGILCCLLFLLGKTEAQIKNTGQFLHEVFNALKSHDEIRFKKLFPDAVKMRIILKSMMEQEEGTDSINSKAANAVLEMITDSILNKGYQETYTGIMNLAEAAGINWQDAAYVYHTADTIAAKEFEGNILKGMIVLKSGSKEFFINYEGAIWFKEIEGWMGITVSKIGEMKYPD